MRIAVTGGNGDMGRSLIPYLLEQGHAVLSLDLTLPPDPWAAPGLLEHRIADNTDFGQVAACLHGCEAVVHLAAIRSPLHHPAPVVYAANTTGSYNVLCAAAALGIRRVCLASSINAIGGAFSRAPRYDYFPVDERHPTYAEEPYGLSKWVLEQQADSIARRYEQMSIASLRLHWLVESRERAQALTSGQGTNVSAPRHLWAYTLLSEASRACLLSLTADFIGHHVLYITAPRTAAARPSLELAAEHYPDTPVRGDLSGHKGFFDCTRAENLLGWRHEE